MKTTYTCQDVKDQAQGNWQAIHAALGIPQKLLNGKHQPCPYCGGKDRFRYTNHQQQGGYICNQCTSQGGSGFDLLMLVYGYDFQTALQQVASVLGIDQTNAINAPHITPAPRLEPEPCQDKQEKLSALLAQSKPIIHGCPVYQYLQGRGLTLNDDMPQALHYLPSLTYWHDNQKIGNYPAMLSTITNLAGELVGLHQTYLQPIYNKPYGDNGLCIPDSYQKLTLSQYPNAPVKKMQSRYIGALKGAGVQLYPIKQDGYLLVSEGIETALAAMELFSIDPQQYGVLAALSANGMANLALPDNTHKLLIIADHDHPRATGYHAGHSLAVRAIKAGIKVDMWQPETPNSDALDELNALKNRPPEIQTA